MSFRSLFVTRLYEAHIGDDTLIAELARSIRMLSKEDEAGRRWSKDHHYAGYTSYASLDDLTRRDPIFSSLVRLLDRHTQLFARECAFDLKRKPRLDSLWVNLLKSGGHHSGHIHPNSIISGTFYVEVPRGSGNIRFEDPRLHLMMAAPQRAADAPEELRSFVSVEPKPGLLLLWESWLRHEVLPGKGRGERLSISFNFA
ncbi:MAG TPA: TIGR02466 family protein [Sphingomicrobium sp.]|nr:TIGR02466 family protein [Sphingomicrobium sp.]